MDFVSILVSLKAIRFSQGDQHTSYQCKIWSAIGLWSPSLHHQVSDLGGCVQMKGTTKIAIFIGKKLIDCHLFKGKPGNPTISETPEWFSLFQRFWTSQSPRYHVSQESHWLFPGWLLLPKFSGFLDLYPQWWPNIWKDHNDFHNASKKIYPNQS